MKSVTDIQKFQASLCNVTVPWLLDQQPAHQTDWPTLQRPTYVNKYMALIEVI